VAAQTLAKSSARLGLVLTHEEFAGPIEATLAMLPTALLLPSDDTMASRLLSRCYQCLPIAVRVPLVVVARPERRINDRRLDQTVSTFAPYTEDVLDALVAPNREVA